MTEPGLARPLNPNPALMNVRPMNGLPMGRPAMPGPAYPQQQPVGIRPMSQAVQQGSNSMPRGPPVSIANTIAPRPVDNIQPQQQSQQPMQYPASAINSGTIPGRRAYPQQQSPVPAGMIAAGSGQSQIAGLQPLPAQTTMNQPQMGQPQMGQLPIGQPQMVQQPPIQVQKQAFIQTGTVPQFSGALPPQFGAPQPQQQGFVPQAQQQFAPQQQFANGMGQLQNGMQNMQLASNVGNSGYAQPQQPQQQAFVNLLQARPSPAEIEQMQSPSMVSPQLSVSQSPNAVCPSVYKRCTLNAIPQTQSMLGKTKIPFGLVVTPYRSLLPGEEPVPVINPPLIVRCRRCRAYINPWIQFVEQGTRWKCNMCYLTNEVPGFYDWDAESRQQVDRMKRPELTHSVVEYIAPQEYMVRPPQPVVLLFIIDVSLPAVKNGMLATVARGILDYLDDIPNSDGRTKVAFITVDSTLQFWNLNSSFSEPQMLVVADLEEAFLPVPDDLLVTLTESRTVVEKLLANLPNMFRNTQNIQNVLGRALQFGFKMINAIGGKIVVFQASLPNFSEGGLKMREDSKVLGTPKEVTLLQPASPFYKNFAVDCSRAQIAIDLFAFNSQYLDYATLSGLPKVTGGSMHYYPTFNVANPQDPEKFRRELQNFFSRPLALEAVLRVRASKGIRTTGFHGNFFLRSTDLLALPAVDPDYAYGIEMEIQDNLQGNMACFQTALLHTSSSGERRIRVITLTVPVTDALGEIYNSADQYAIAALWAKKAVEKCLGSHIEAARDEMVNKLCDIVGTYKSTFTSSGQNGMLVLPENLKLLPLLVMSTLKHTAFKTSGITPSDIRSHAMALMCVYPCEAFIPAVYPRFWALHSMDALAGTIDDETSQVIFPPVMNLSSERLERHGLYLLENGSDVLLWVGRNINPELCGLVLGVPSYDTIVAGKMMLPQIPGSVWNKRVHNLIDRIQQVRTLQMTVSPSVWIVKEDGVDATLRMMFLSCLVEDKLDSGNSYPLFLGYIREKLNKPSGLF
ncbi:COPII subunit [Entophlyctis luteolus]|nr:COPII subunit [Entophlyctis luteolus]